MMAVSVCVAVFASYAAFFSSLDTAIPLRGAGKKKKQDLDVSVALRPYFLAGRAALAKLPAVLNISIVVWLKKEKDVLPFFTRPSKGIYDIKRKHERRARPLCSRIRFTNTQTHHTHSKRHLPMQLNSTLDNHLESSALSISA